MKNAAQLTGSKRSKFPEAAVAGGQSRAEPSDWETDGKIRKMMAKSWAMGRNEVQ